MLDQFTLPEETRTFTAEERNQLAQVEAVAYCVLASSRDLREAPRLVVVDSPQEGREIP